MKYYRGLNGCIYSETNIQDAYYIFLGRQYNPKIDNVIDLLGVEKEIEPTVEDFIRDNKIVRATSLYYQQQRAAGNDISIKEAKEAVELIRKGMQDDIELLDAETALKHMKEIMDRTPADDGKEAHA